LAPGEFWWLVDARKPKNGKGDTDYEALYAMMEEAERNG
jgi:hypothetical protein